MDIPIILIIAVLIVYLVWKLIGTGKKKPEQRRFSIRKHRKKEMDDEEDE